MFSDKLKSKIDRSCGTCTVCCSGFLHLECDGELFTTTGLPCRYLATNGGGCSIWKSSKLPKCCKKFLCLYREDNTTPEWIKPNISKVLITLEKHNNLNYLFLMECGSGYDKKIVEWIFENYELQKYKTIVIVNKQQWYILSQDLDERSKIVDFYKSNNNAEFQDAINLPFVKKYFEGKFEGKNAVT